jgi:secretion/DNA translocation related TadE-like protein
VTRPGDRRSRDSGSATILMLGIAAVVLAAGCATAMLAAAISARHSAQAAADLAALAAATHIGIDDGGCAAAERIASRNGAQLDGCVIQIAADGRSGIVEVTVSRPAGTGPLAGLRATARAAAEREPSSSAP